MTKLLNSEKLRREIVEAIIRLSSQTQSIMGAAVWLALGNIWSERSDASYWGGKNYYEACYSPKEAIDVIRSILLGFCVDESERRKFEKEWPAKRLKK